MIQTTNLQQNDTEMTYCFYNSYLLLDYSMEYWGQA